MRRPVVTLLIFVVSTMVCLSVGTPDSLAQQRAPANPRGVADPR